MNRTRLGLLLLAAAAPAAAQDSALVVVVATTDVHGAATAWDYVADREAPGGLVRAATVIDSLRRAHPGAVVLLDGGDLIQGNLFAAYFAAVQPRQLHPLVDVMNAMGYDALTPGDHEFDFGLDVLARAFGGAGFPLITANVYRLPRDTFAYAPHVILPRGGVRVGVTGFTTPGTLLWHREKLRDRLVIRPIPAVAEDVIGQLKASGADLTVAVVHGGMDGESSYDTTGVGAEHPAARLAGLRNRPDVVIVGHSHRHFGDSVINGVHFVQPQPNARSLAVVKVWLVRAGGPGGSGAGYRVARVLSQDLSLARVPPSRTLVERLRDGHETVRNWASQPVANAEGDWSGREGRVRDTPLLDFINGVQRRTARAHLSATPAVDTTAGFRSGPIRLRDVAGIAPSEYTLRSVRIDGARLKRYLEHSARFFRAWQVGGAIINDSISPADYDVVSGVQYEIDLTQPLGSRIRNLSYQGRPVADSDVFLMALDSRRQVGTGGYDMLAGLPVVYDAGQKIRDLLVDAVTQSRVVRATDHLEQSWRLVPREAERLAIETFTPPPPQRDTALLRILATGHVRGGLEPANPEWAGDRRVAGAAATKAWMDSLARACGCPTIRLDAGDALAGTALSDLFTGRPVVEAYNVMGYDAMAVGDYEFAFTLDTLAARATASRFPWLAANVTDSTGEGRAGWAREWVMIERGGRRIGVVGLATASPTDTVNPMDVARLSFAAPGPTLERLLPAVRQAGAEFVIVLAHGGRRCDTACRDEPIADDLAPGAVDLVVTGHGSRRVRATAAGIPVVSVGHPGEVAVVDIIRRAAGQLEARLRVDTVWADAVTPDTAVARIVATYARDAERTLGRRVAGLKFALAIEGGGERPLGRLVADAFRAAARTDLAIVPNTAIRAGMPAGAVTYAQVRTVLPESARLVRVELPGDTLMRVLEQLVSGTAPSAYVSGLTIRYDPRQRAGRRIREVRLVDGRSIERRTTYSLVVAETLTAPGSAFAQLRRPAELVGVRDLEALVRYLGVLAQPVEAPETARIVSTR